MSSYYNENDKFAAAWLRELIKAKLIADGDVDERSIVDVQASDLSGYTQCHFFAGIGGWSLALRWAGVSDDQIVWTGSCPCQPFSASGWGHGENDERDLWPIWWPLIKKCRPTIVFGEQVSGKAGLSWLDRLSDDMEDADYAIAAANLCAPSVRAPDIRQRLFFVADCDGARLALRHETSHRDTESAACAWRELERIHAASDWSTWQDQSGVGVFDDGVSNRLLQGSVRGFGNAIKPQVAATFIQAYCDARGE